ncbi:hypothetical protein [Nocardia salmonicida]|uniref:hypothetical protein n=1 Tax=Nocardia salmonicida TaxID=53431 RepID=UPI00363D13B5
MSRGQRRRIPTNFPRMRDRARKRRQRPRIHIGTFVGDSIKWRALPRSLFTNITIRPAPLAAHVAGLAFPVLDPGRVHLVSPVS